MPFSVTVDVFSNWHTMNASRYVDIRGVTWYSSATKLPPLQSNDVKTKESTYSLTVTFEKYQISHYSDIGSFL